MSEQWFLRVEDREYGPADLAMLREWKEDGRVLRENEARPEDSDMWVPAAEIPGLFAPEPPDLVQTLPGAPPVQSPGFFRICFDTVALYIKGFFSLSGPDPPCGGPFSSRSADSGDGAGVVHR